MMPIKNILFDFDGVIIDSNSIKDDAYRYIFREYVDKLVDKFIKYHQKNGAISRYIKIKYFYEEFLGKKCSESSLEKHLTEFSEVTLEKLSNKDLLINSTVNFIKQNTSLNYHIVSGTDENDLNKLCKALEIDNQFLSIKGSPTEKNELVKNILDKYNYQKEETRLIGDSIKDFEAANSNNIVFYGFNNLKLKKSGFNYLENFNELIVYN